jgi:hypothetical protein
MKRRSSNNWLEKVFRREMSKQFCNNDESCAEDEKPGTIC